jgi:uncharacterized protein YbaP (TraB family)
MRRWILVFAVALTGCDRGSSSSSPPPKPPANDNAPVAAPTPAPLMWIVHAEAGPSYLLGTMHLGIDAHRDLPKVVFATLDGARVFVMEADISEIDSDDMIALARQPGDERLDQDLTAQQWQALTAVLPAFPPSALRRFRPWFVVVAIAQGFVPQTEVMDGVLLARARDSGLKVAFLETWKYQIEVLDEAVGIADIVDILDNYDTTKQEMLDFAAGFRAGDADAIAELLFDPKKYAKNPKMIDLLFTKRNKEWMPLLVKHIADGNAFVAVGAGHLLGENGLVALLRKRGYRVERFEPATRRERLQAPASGAR